MNNTAPGLSTVPWNFAYFLTNGKGKVMKYYSPGTPPPELEDDLKTLID